MHFFLNISFLAEMEIGSAVLRFPLMLPDAKERGQGKRSEVFPETPLMSAIETDGVIALSTLP